MYSTSYNPTPRKRKIDYKYIAYGILAVVALYLVITIFSFIVGLFSDGSPNIVGTASLIQGDANIKLKDGIEVKLILNKDENLFENEVITTGRDSYAIIRLNGGVVLRMDELSSLKVSKNLASEKSVESIVAMTTGQIWVDSPKSDSTKKYNVRIDNKRTQIKLIGTKISAYSDDAFDAIRVFEGQVSVGVLDASANEVTETVTLGVGQESVITNQIQKLFAIGQNPGVVTAINDEYKSGSFYRWNATFYNDSINIPVVKESDGVIGSIGVEDGVVSIISPTDGQKTSKSLLDFSGTFTRGKVVEILVNNKKATFENETWKVTALPVPKEGENTFTIEGKNALGNVIYRNSIKVLKDLSPLPIPVVTFPPNDKTIWAEDKIEITGTVTPDTAKVEVNDFVLTKFKPGNTEWKYLANRLAGNMKYGLNTFTIYGIDESGNKSTPKVISIYLRKPDETVTLEQIFGSGAKSNTQTTTTSTATSTTVTKLNPPIILEPNGGKDFTTSNPKNTLTGIAPEGTVKIRINENRTLQLYKPGDKNWRFFAWTNYNTLVPGKNTYKVYAIDKNGVASEPAILNIIYDPNSTSTGEPTR